MTDNENSGQILNDDQRELEDHSNFGITSRLTSRYSYDPFASDGSKDTINKKASTLDGYDPFNSEYDSNDNSFRTAYWRKPSFYVPVIISTVLILFLISVIGLFSQEKEKRSINQTPPTPYYDLAYLDFPKGMRDYKFTIDKYNTMLYQCLMEDSNWHPCYPVMVENKEVSKKE